MSFKGYASATDWARGVPGPSPYSLRDVEAVIVHFRPDSAVVSGLRPPMKVGIGGVSGWLGVALVMVTLVFAAVGPSMYFDGTVRSTRGGMVDYGFDPDRASWLVPISFGFLSLVLVWSILDWVRSGRRRGQLEVYLAIFIGGSAAVALWCARNIGVDIAFGANLESVSMWICAVLGLIACAARLICSRKSDLPGGKRGQQNVGFELRAERRELVMILKGRGLLNEPDLEAGLAKPFGFHLREDGRLGM